MVEIHVENHRLLSTLPMMPEDDGGMGQTSDFYSNLKGLDIVLTQYLAEYRREININVINW